MHNILDQLVTDVEDLPIEHLLALTRHYSWVKAARPKQLAPEDFFVWMLMAGRGTGKTRSGAEEIWYPAFWEPQRIAVVGPTLADVRKTCFEGESGLLSVVPEPLVKSYNRTSCEMWMLTADGSQSYFVGYSSEEPDRLRGPQHHRAWCDELAAWRYIDETWDMLMFGLRLGASPNVVVTTTPKPVGLLRTLLQEDDTVLSRESTYDNAANLPKKYLEKLRKKYEGTRLGRQELHAEILDDNPFAMWSQALLDKTRHQFKDGPLPDMHRRVVAIDPPKTTGEDADECGIVAAGRHGDHCYVTHDWSMGGLSPHGWASRAVSLYHNTRADAIVAEVNNGGDMVQAMIQQVDPGVPVIKVTATRGKVVRAEPVAMLWEQGRAHMVGHLADLEDQMCDFTTDFDKDVMGYSPDRVDALVWAVSNLMLDDSGSYSMLDSL